MNLFEAGAYQIEEQGRVAFGAQQTDLDASCGSRSGRHRFLMPFLIRACVILLCGIGCNFPYCLVFEVNAEILNPAITAVQKCHEIAQQPLHGKKQQLMIVDGAGKFLPQVESIGRPEKIQCFGNQTAQLIQMQQQGIAKAPLESVTRHGKQVSQGADSHAMQRFSGIIGQAGVPNRQGAQHLHQGAVGGHGPGGCTCDIRWGGRVSVLSTVVVAVFGQCCREVSDMR